jgi:hypothetical protein
MSLFQSIIDFCCGNDRKEKKCEFVPEVKIDNDNDKKEIDETENLPNIELEQEVKIDVNLETDLDLILVEPELETTQVLDSPITYHTTYIS